MTAKPIREAMFDSLEPIADAALLGSEWAIIREATAAERNRLGIARHRIATAFVLRTCQTPRTLIVWQERRRPLFGGDPAGHAARLARKHGLQIEHAASIIALAGAGVLAPELIARLASQLPERGRCEGCNCIWGASGPFDPNSMAAQAVRALALGDDESARRIAA